MGYAVVVDVAVAIATDVAVDATAVGMFWLLLLPLAMLGVSSQESAFCLFCSRNCALHSRSCDNRLAFADS